MKPKANFAHGKATIQIRLWLLGSEMDGTIVYPDLYPYFRPSLHVFGLGCNLRHYDSRSGYVCLLERGSQHWLPQMTAAQHILEMLPHWEAAAVRKYGDSRLEREDGQAEPLSVYYPAVQGQYVLIDSSWQVPPEITAGRIKIAFPKGYKSLLPSETFSAWVAGLQDSNKNPIPAATLPDCLQQWIHSQNFIDCVYPWKRIDSLPVARTPDELANLLAASNPEVAAHLRKEIAAVRSGLYGFCFPEESPAGGYRDGWIFIAYHCDIRAKRGGRGGASVWIIRTEYAGEKDLFERVPELNPLRQRTVAVIGLGCVGAPSALAFARAGVGELRLLDGDHVSPGTVCRWPLGLPASGAGKVKEISTFVSQQYPFTRIGTAHYDHESGNDGRVTIGACDVGKDQWDCLEKLIEGADLVYDATAEQGINLLLADLASSRKIPYVAVASRAGGWGGDVLRIRPGSTEGCYLCYLHSLRAQEIPHPPYDPKGDGLQPVGCGDVTFKAASFDVEEVALAGVRVAVSTLCEHAVGGYPRLTGDVGVLSLRNEGQAVFPEWRSYTLRKHPACERCNK